MKNLKQKFLDTWVKCLSLILSFLGFSACIGDGPDLYGCPTDEYQEIDLKVHGNVINEQGQVIKSTITVKTSDDGVNFQPFQTVTTNDYGYYSFSHCFYDRCKKVRFVVSDDKNYYLPDSVDLQLNYANGGTLYEVEEFNFTLSPRIEF